MHLDLDLEVMTYNEEEYVNVSVLFYHETNPGVRMDGRTGWMERNRWRHPGLRLYGKKKSRSSSSCTCSSFIHARRSSLTATFAPPCSPRTPLT